MHYHNALITRSFFAQTRTTAGYDPYFMAGYAKSIVSDPSGTLIDVVIAVFGGDRPAFVYKLLTLGVIASLPWFVMVAIRLLGGGGDAMLSGTAAFLIYLWTDFPMQYAGFGMTTFLLVVPMSLTVLALIIRFLDRGGFGRWLSSAIGSSALILVHPLAMLTVVPSAIVTYVALALGYGRTAKCFPIRRHLGVLAIPILVAVTNAFWWLPGVLLAATRDTDGPDFFSHTEPVWSRIGQIFGFVEPHQSPIQIILLGGAFVGIAALLQRRTSYGIGLFVFMGTSFFWGYLAGGFRVFDFLQPGRWTYAAYTCGAVATGFGWSAIRTRIARGPGRLERWATLALLLIALRVFGQMVAFNFEFRTGRPIVALEDRADGGLRSLRFFARTNQAPYLSSTLTPDLSWIVSQIRDHFGPGDRILFEEGGQASEGLIDPFGGRRLGGLLPTLAGVEVIGGPFLHVPVRANFTQYGMGRLCGMQEWGLEDFERFGRLYGPEGIVCWSPKSRAFCLENPDLCEIIVDREPILIARIRGFEGDTIRGQAKVEATAGRLTVEPVAADVDGMIVLRYHSVPGLRSDPPGLLRAVEMAGDPVPFIGLVPPPEGPVIIEWHASP